MIKPILSLVVIILSLGFGIFYGKPQYDRVQEKRANLVSLADTSKSIQAIETIIAETGKSLSEVGAEDVTRFNVFLPETIDSVRLANNLQHVGTADNVVFLDIKVEEDKKKLKTKDIQPVSAMSTLSNVLSLDRSGTQVGTTPANPSGAAASNKKYATTKASFSFIATYTDFSKFLKDIERSLGLINITSLSFQEFEGGTVTDGSPAKSSVTFYKFAVEFETYSLK